jgi:hypothetical protein
VAQRETTLDLALVLAIIAAVIYAVTKVFSSQTVQQAAQAVSNTTQNVLTGAPSSAQQQALIDQETQQLIKAGMPPDQAKAQATADVTQAIATDPTTWWDQFYGGDFWSAF